MRLLLHNPHFKNEQRRSTLLHRVAAALSNKVQKVRELDLLFCLKLTLKRAGVALKKTTPAGMSFRRTRSRRRYWLSERDCEHVLWRMENILKTSCASSCKII